MFKATKKGNSEIYGSKDATREAFRYGIIENGEIWMDMIKSRNNTSHTCNEETADRIVKAILSDYHIEYVELHRKFSELKLREQG
ncbi:MAG: nucleotidyltransferase substrate binding protein [Candidatus Sabulitectum sp.]|nr:nucleotidyltransferase substrate binding protein [Candidatus Sabulitectum sp.]